MQNKDIMGKQQQDSGRSTEAKKKKKKQKRKTSEPDGEVEEVVDARARQPSVPFEKGSSARRIGSVAGVDEEVPHRPKKKTKKVRRWEEGEREPDAGKSTAASSLSCTSKAAEYAPTTTCTSTSDPGEREMLAEEGTTKAKKTKGNETSKSTRKKHRKEKPRRRQQEESSDSNAATSTVNNDYHKKKCSASDAHDNNSTEDQIQDDDDDDRDGSSSLEGVMHEGTMYLVDKRKRVFSTQRDALGELLQVGRFDDGAGSGGGGGVVLTTVASDSPPTAAVAEPDGMVREQGEGGRGTGHAAEKAEDGKKKKKKKKKKKGSTDVKEEAATVVVSGGRGAAAAADAGTAVEAVEYPFEVEVRSSHLFITCDSFARPPPGNAEAALSE